MASVRIKRDTFGRSQIADFICPDNGYRGALKRRGMKPKNHMKENFQSLRILERNKRDQIEQEQVEKESKERSDNLYKLSQFRHVESRVYDTERFERYNNPPLSERSNTDNSRSDDNHTGYLQRGTLQNRIREHEERVGRAARQDIERKFAEARDLAEAPISPRKAPVPKEVSS